MKNKKGFTLIEIIICIGLIVLIGTSSIVGFKIISNKKLITKLEQISERASEAAQVYIETNDTATNQLYNNKNGVSLPLQLLVNVGLLSLEGTELTEEDIKDQYVVTFLGGTGSSENCEQITSTNSWSNNQPIYLCLNSNGSSNLATIDPTKYGNRTTASQEPYYFVGAGINNYVKYNDNTYQIYYIDTDDTLVLYSESNFGSVFNGNTLPITNYSVKQKSTYQYAQRVYCGNDSRPRIGELYYKSTSEGESCINEFDVIKTSYCIYFNSYVDFLDAWMNFNWDNYGNFSTYGYYIETSSGRNACTGYKIHLNNKFKLGSGTGDYSNPYMLEYKN